MTSNQGLWLFLAILAYVLIGWVVQFIYELSGYTPQADPPPVLVNVAWPIAICVLVLSVVWIIIRPFGKWFDTPKMAIMKVKAIVARRAYKKEIEGRR